MAEPNEDTASKVEEERVGKWMDLMGSDLQMKVSVQLVVVSS
jgi:hypothetical protein